MSTEIEKLKSNLFGPEGFGVTNISIFPGTDRSAKPEDVARQINNSLDELLKGEFEELPIE